MFKTQMSRIINQLEKDGRVTRNWCLARNITRLGARISDLKRAGWTFNPFYQKQRFGKDYVYEVVDKPIDRDL